MVNLGELVFSIIAEDKASATVGQVGAKIGQSMAVAGAAITAFGGAATLLIDRNREMDASFRTTALSAGLPAESIKELARSLQSVDEPIGNVSRTLDLLARSGMENAETMGSTAAAFDLLGDAIGATSDEVAAAMVPAFKSLNVPLEEAPQHVDALTVAFREANIDLDGFADVMGEQGPALGEMGVSLEEAAAMMMIFAENGVVGENVSEQLNEAINNCDGSTTKLYRSLGMSSGQIAEYSAKLENSAGAAQEFADAQNSAFGTVDKLGFELDKLGQYAGDMLAPFEGVATACLAIGPAMTIAGSAASLLDNEMMVKLFPSLGKVVTGITGAGGLVPALGSLTTSLGLTSAGLTTFATAAAAIAVPLVALVGTCALLGPAVDAAADAWVKFLGGTYDTTAALEGVEEQYDITTGAVVRYADEQTEAAIIAADASLQYDGITGAIIENAEAIAVAEQAYDEFGNAIEGTTGTIQTAVPIYDEFGTCIGEMAPDIRDADEAASDAAVSFDEWGNVLEDIPPQIDGIATSVDNLAGSMKEWADSYGAWTDSVRNGTAESEMEKKAREQAGMDFGEVVPSYVVMGENWSKDVEGSKEAYLKAHPSQADKLKPDAPTKTPSGASPGSTEKTWAGKGDPDYTGGDPEAWRTDARLKNEAATATRNYADAVATVAPPTREATASTRELDTGIGALSSTSSAATAPIQAETTAVTGLGSAAPAAAAGLTYFRDAQGNLTDMVMQAPVPLNAEAAAVTGAGAAASAATPKVTGLNTGIAGTASAASGATGPVSGLGSAVASTGSQATSAAGQINGATSAINGAKAAAASASSVLAATAGNLGSVAASANTAANSFVSMGRQYLTARNSIQSNPITSIHTIKTIVEGGGANVAPGASATKYYPKFHEGGVFEAPSGQSEGFAKLLDGERVLSRAETKEYEGGGIAAAVAAGIAKGLSAVGLGGGGDVIVHGDVKLSEDYSYDRFREDVGRWKSSRIAKGVL